PNSEAFLPHALGSNSGAGDVEERVPASNGKPATAPLLLSAASLSAAFVSASLVREFNFSDICFRASDCCSKYLSMADLGFLSVPSASNLYSRTLNICFRALSLSAFEGVLNIQFFF